MNADERRSFDSWSEASAPLTVAPQKAEVTAPKRSACWGARFSVGEWRL